MSMEDLLVSLFTTKADNWF